MTSNNNISRISILFLFSLMAGIINAQNGADAILKSQAMISSGKNSEAVNVLTEAINKGGNYMLYSNRADIYIAQGNLSAAINDLNEANKLSEHSGDFGLAQVYAKKGDIKTSLYHLSQHLGSGFRKSEKEVMLDPVLSAFENRPEWRQFWKKEWYSYPETTAAEVEFLAGSGKLDEAANTISELRGRYPESNELIYSEVLLAVASKRYNDAVSGAAKLIADDPGNAKYLKILAEAQAGQLNFAGASATYTKLIDKGIPDASLFLRRAECYRKTRETDKSLGDIEKFLSLYPEDKHALSLAGKVESESGDNLRAIEYFSRNLRLHPNDQECYIDRANAYLAAKSWDWAAKDYSMSLDLRPENPDVWLNKGVALLGSGKIADACHDFRMAYSLGNQKASPYISKHCLK
jgi:tetratricopeptide (TPR) repeat protein